MFKYPVNVFMICVAAVFIVFAVADCEQKCIEHGYDPAASRVIK